MRHGRRHLGFKVSFVSDAVISFGETPEKLMLLPFVQHTGPNHVPQAHKNIVLAQAKPTIADVRSIVMADGGAAPLPIHATISVLDRRLDEMGAGKHGNKSQN